MGKKFILFEKWYLSKKEGWKQQGVSVDSTGLAQYGHQYWIKLHSENGLANIVLYESNGYYWVDFEGGSYNHDKLYQKSGIEFNGVTDLDSYEIELMNQILQNDNTI